MSLLENLFRLATQTFTTNPISEPNCTRLIDACSHLKAEQVPFDQKKYEPIYASAQVTGGYMSLFETDSISMGIFSVRAGNRLPLHDHREMYGLIRVLTGQIEVQSYSLCAEQPVEPDRSLLHQLSDPAEADLLLCAIVHEPVVLNADRTDVAMLTPHERNFHEIRAIPSSAGFGAAFLDILSPPYSNQRDCNYFQVIGKQHCAQLGSEIAWILPLDCAPADFATMKLPYEGPPLKY